MKAHKIPVGKVRPGRHQKRKGSAGNADGIENFGSKIVPFKGIYHADENVDAAKMERNKFPFPLAGGKGTDMFPKFVGNKQGGHYIKEFLPGFFVKFPVIKHCGDNNSDKKRRYEKVNRAEMFKIYVIRVYFIHC